MVKKKNKPTKKGRKRALKEDVHATTSLPPSVEGQLRCFLRVSISKIVWLSAKPPDTTHVRLRWWGEITEGSIFRPLDVKNPQKTTTKTVARYPVRCGPKQFAAYLNDMGTLILEVLKGPNMQPIGKAQINEIGHLAPQVPINGFYSVFSYKSADKIAELHVSLVFEPLPAAYDSSSSIPTTDLSVATAGTGTTAESSSIQSQPARTGSPLPEPRPRRVMSSSSEDPFMSPIPKVPHQRQSDPKQTLTPRGLDSDYSFVIGPGQVDKPSDQRKGKTTAVGQAGLGGQHPASDTGRGRSSDTDDARGGPTEVETLLGRNTDHTRRDGSELVSRRHHTLNPSSQAGSDLISALLDRGTKLRDNMIRSELDRAQPTTRGAIERLPQVTPSDALTGDVDIRDTRPYKRRSSGELFREILRTDDAHKPGFNVSSQDRENGFENSNMDTQTIELLIGNRFSTQELNDLKTLQSGMSPHSSVSSESDVLSETEDPLKDQSILEELFYRGVRSGSDSSLSDLLSSDDDDAAIKKPKESSARRRRRRWSYESSLSDPGNQRPPSRRTKQPPRPATEGTPVKDPGGRLAIPSTHEPVGGRQPKRLDGRTRRGSQRSGSGSMSEVASSDSDVGSASRVSEGSRVSFQEPLVAEKEVNPEDGLSIQRLTLLGRVHIARVMVDSLSLKASYTPSNISTPDTRPSRGGRGRGRPPRPSIKPKTKRCTYFVEYHFPVTASPREQSLVNTMAMEVMRLVSKKVDDKGGAAAADGLNYGQMEQYFLRAEYDQYFVLLEMCNCVTSNTSAFKVTFGHRSVFPVRFDGTAVDSWWKQLLVFRIFSRTAGQKSPILLGVASLPLRSVLQSPDLSLINVELDAKNKKQSGPSSGKGAESGAGTDGTLSDLVIGTLKVSIELASDSKDFPMALARMKVAEIRGAKIVPLPSNQPHLPIKIPTGSVESDSKSSSRSVQTDSVMAEVFDNTSGAIDSVRNYTEGGHTVEEKSQVQPSKTQAQRNKERQQEQPTREMRTGGEIGEKRQDDASANTKVDYEARTLHSLLLIPEGRGVTIHGIAPVKSRDSTPHTPPKPHAGAGVGISGLGGGSRDQTTRNTYLVCRLFWSDDSVRSNVCWGTTEPNYNFVQVSPVLLTSSLLGRARNNCMVIEVWDKKTSAQNDQLVGIAKLPLHQFYMSFRDDRIASTLLKSQYPVAAVDNYVNIIDPFTGIQYGQLKVLLALGSAEQISALQRLKCDKDAVDTRPLRPGHYLERGEAVGKNVSEQEPSETDLVEHIFEVVVEGIRGLPQLEDTVWGEADCFVQYHFPSQSQPRGAADGVTALSVGPVLTPHQTPTTLCMPDPTFHDVARHRLQLARGAPVQRELLTACAGVGGGAGGIPFEVWCRYYYPNIRDQVIAKTSLPLAKLCAMVTMQRRGEPSIQTFSLPLRLQHPDQESLTKEQLAKLQDAGLLDVTINYRHSVVQGGSSVPRTREMGSSQVCLSVGVLRACGLKSAATSLAQYDSSLQYASEVGVNAYVKMELSFLSKQEVRVTQTVARTFAPEFSHHVDFPCPLLFEERESDHLSLAEALETAEMTLQVWHQVPGFKSGHADTNFITTDSEAKPGMGMSARRLFAPTGDILLGTTTVPLHSLLSHRTGLQGWYPLSTPAPGWVKHPPSHPSDHPSSDSPKSMGRHGLERAAGGLELSIRFAHQGDRDRVAEAGRRVGWSPEEELDELWDAEGSATGSYSARVSVHVDSAWFPAHTALRPGQRALDSAAKAYVRYKFYDKGAVCSKLCYLDVNEESYIAADFKHSRDFHMALSQPLAWYLREEHLEIQLWISYNRDLSPTETGHTRPRQRDKLIGCAYIDMSALCDKRIKQHRISGLYPLFRPGASDLGGSCLRVHLSLQQVHSGPHPQQESSDEAELQMADDTRHTRPSHRRHLWPSPSPHNQEQAVEAEEAARRLEDEMRRQQEEEDKKKRKEPVLLGVAVERAMHLVSIPFSNRLEDCPPSCYVTFQPANGSPIHTATVPDNDQPVWGFEQDVRISSEVLDRQSFIFKVWHLTSSEPDMNSDRMLGFASVDLAPLLAGFRSLNGWYNILDFSGHCQGQIKVSLTPRESVSPLKHSPKPKTTPNTSAIFAQGFPHVPITTLPPRQSSKSGRSSPSQSAPPSSSHYQEHLQNVRKFHVDLHNRLRSQQRDSTTVVEGGNGKRGIQRVPATAFDDGGPLPSTVSNSFLMQNLRKNLQELDTIYHGLQQKLASQDPLQEIPSYHDNKHPNTQHPEPTKPLGKVTSDHDIQERPSDHLHDSPQDATSLPDGTRRISDEDILEKIRYDLRKKDAEYNSDELDEDGSNRLMQNRDSDGDSAKSPQPESDWEDSVQFQGSRDHESDGDEDLIIPKPLNDVSSANFSNSIGPDAVVRSDTTDVHQRGKVDTSSGTSIQEGNDASSEILRLQKSRDQHSFVTEQEFNPEPGFTDQVWGKMDPGKLPFESKERTGSVEEEEMTSKYEMDRLDFAEDLNRNDVDNEGQVRDKTPDANSQRISDRNFQEPEGVNIEDNDQELSPAASDNDNGHRLDGDFGEDQWTDTRPEFQEDPSQIQVSGSPRGVHDQQMSANNATNQPVAEDFVTSGPASGRRYEKAVGAPGEDESNEGTGVGRRRDEGDRGSHGSSSDDSVVITIDSRQAEKQAQAVTRTEQPGMAKHVPAKSPPAQLPNFFLPTQDLEASMRALHNVTSTLPRMQARQIPDDHTSDSNSRPTDAAKELTQRLASKHSATKSKVSRLPLKPAYKMPTAEEARRIAKIFASRYSES